MIVKNHFETAPFGMHKVSDARRSLHIRHLPEDERPVGSRRPVSGRSIPADSFHHRLSPGRGGFQRGAAFGSAAAWPVLLWNYSSKISMV